MTSTTQTNFDPALKQIYRESNVQKLTYAMRPLFGMLPKFEGFGGRNMPVVLQYGNPMGRSAVFSTAQSNRTQVKLGAFLLTRVNNYSVATIDGEVVESTRGDNYAFLEALKLKIDTAMAALADDIETELFRDGNGYIARIATAGLSSANPMVITLAQVEEITGFEVGMVILADDTITGASLKATPASITIAGVDRSAGTITTGYDNSGSTTDWAAADYLFVSGDQATGAGTTNFRKIAGLDAWCPSSTTSTSFFGVDRTVDSRLAGLTHTGTSDTLEDAAIDAQSKASREGGMPDVFFLHHAQVRRLNKELGAKKEYTESNASGPDGLIATVGYRGIVINGDHGPINVIAANKCQANVGWMLQKDVWTLNTLGPAVKMLMEDNLRILRQASADGYEVRLGSRGQLGCKAPIWNVRVSLPTP